MDVNLLDDVSKITGKDVSELQPILDTLSLDELYDLLDMVNRDDEFGVKRMINTYQQKVSKDNPLSPPAKDTSTQQDTSADDTTNDNTQQNNSSTDNTNGDDQQNTGSDDAGNQNASSGDNDQDMGADEKSELDALAGAASDDQNTETKESYAPGKKQAMSKKSKIVIPATKPRDPMARELAKEQYRPQVTPTKKGKLDKMQNKHKAKGLDEAFSSVDFWIDDSQAFDKVLESFGESINFDGDKLDTDVSTWKRIKESLTAGGYTSGSDFGRTTMTKKVKEGVLGMSRMPGLRRMMELAGMPADQINQMGVDSSLPVTTDAVDPAMDTSDIDGMDMGDDDLGIEDGSNIDADDLTDDFGMDDMDPAPAGSFADPMGADDMDMDMGDPAMGTDASPAYTLISDALTSVQNSLPDVKISEYKTLIQRLEELTNQLRQIGQSYLGS
jgi:hypothetical protein